MKTKEEMALLLAAEGDLLAAIGETRRKLGTLEAELREVRTAAAPVKVGDIVWLTRRKRDGIVRSIDIVPIGRKQWLLVSIKKMDGDWSQQSINAFPDSWEMKE